MLIADMHTHSDFSFDVVRDEKNTIEYMCKTAIARGISHLAITDHYELGYFDDPKQEYEAEKVKNEIDLLKEVYQPKGLTLIFGIEIGQQSQYPDISKAFLEKYDFEYIISSVHNNTDTPDFYYFDYEKIDDGELIKHFENYLSELYILSKSFDFDTLAHVTYPLRYYRTHHREKLIRVEKYFDRYESIFQNIISRGISLEVNSSGIRQGINQPMPDYSLIQLYRDCGGELITVGSDSHGSEMLGSDVSAVYEFLKSIGYRYVTVYDKRKPLPFKI